MTKCFSAAMALGCSLMAALNASGDGTATITAPWGDRFDIRWHDDGTATIGTGSAPSNPAQYEFYVAIPDTVELDDGRTFKVTAIAPNAFKGCTGIGNVSFWPEKFDSIGDYAFQGCTQLDTVNWKGPFPSSSNFSRVFDGTPYLSGVNNDNYNDSIDNCRVLSNASGSGGEDNFLATLDTDEDWSSAYAYPDVAGTKWFEWTAPKSGTVWFDTFESMMNTVMFAYRKSDRVEIAKNDDFCRYGESRITFNAVKGVSYLLCIAGANGERGEFWLHWRMGSPVALTLDVNGGAFDGKDVPKKFTVPKGVAVGTLPTPVRADYTFSGWYTKKSGGTKVTAKTKFSKATKLYARFAKKKFKVSASAATGGAKKVAGSGTYAWGTKVKLTATPKAGYVFMKWEAMDEASTTAFPKYATQNRKNATPKVTVPKTSGLSYKAHFVKKADDYMAIASYKDPTLYAEDGVCETSFTASSKSYPTVTTSKLPAGVKLKLDPAGDYYYTLAIVDPDKVPAGRHVIKVTAKNRSGKTATRNFTVFGKNKTQAVDEGYISDTLSWSAKSPNVIQVGVKKPSPGVTAASGWKLTAVGGLPSGLKWDAKNQKLTGYPTKTGIYTFTYTVAQGKKKYTATATFKVEALPKMLLLVYGGFSSDNGGLHAGARRLNVSVTSAGKVSAKVGNVSFAGTGLAYDKTSGKYTIGLNANYTKGKVKYVRRLDLEFEPQEGFGWYNLYGSYKCYSVKSGVSSPLTVDEIINAFPNVFGKDAEGKALYSEMAQEALERAASEYPSATIDLGDGDQMTVTLNPAKGIATMTGTVKGKSFSETSALWYGGVYGYTYRYLCFNCFSVPHDFLYEVRYDGDTLVSVGNPEFVAY